MGAKKKRKRAAPKPAKRKPAKKQKRGGSKPAKRSRRKPPKPPGRPRTVMTPENEMQILETMKLGVPFDTACCRHAVAGSTGRSHMARHEEFALRVKSAEATAETRLFAGMMTDAFGRPAEFKVIGTGRDRETVCVRAEVKPVWTAKAWLLERRWPDKYARRDHEATTPPTAIGVMGKEAREEMEEILANPANLEAMGAELARMTGAIK